MQPLGGGHEAVHDDGDAVGPVRRPRHHLHAAVARLQRLHHQGTRDRSEHRVCVSDPESQYTLYFIYFKGLNLEVEVL